MCEGFGEIGRRLTFALVAGARRVVALFRTETLVRDCGGVRRISCFFSHSDRIDRALGRAGIDTAGNFVRP
ncbi:MAG: hypothetical protein ACKVPY_01675 [Paracoccaceae bacterium]